MPAVWCLDNMVSQYTGTRGRHWFTGPVYGEFPLFLADFHSWSAMYRDSDESIFVRPRTFERLPFLTKYKGLLRQQSSSPIGDHLTMHDSINIAFSNKLEVPRCIAGPENVRDAPAK